MIIIHCRTNISTGISLAAYQLLTCILWYICIWWPLEPWITQEKYLAPPATQCFIQPGKAIYGTDFELKKRHPIPCSHGVVAMRRLLHLGESWLYYIGTALYYSFPHGPFYWKRLLSNSAWMYKYTDGILWDVIQGIGHVWSGVSSTTPEWFVVRRTDNKSRGVITLNI